MRVCVSQEGTCHNSAESNASRTAKRAFLVSLEPDLPLLSPLGLRRSFVDLPGLTRRPLARAQLLDRDILLQQRSGMQFADDT